MLQSDQDKIQVKREYLKKLEQVQELLLNLYNFGEVSNIRLLHDPYHFTEYLDLFLEHLEDEIEYQNNKLNDLEVTVYNMSDSVQD